MIYCVFKETATSDFKVIDITSLDSELIDKDNTEYHYKIKTLTGGVDWYVAEADTPEEAIAQAVEDGFVYRSKEEMDALWDKTKRLYLAP